MTVAALYATGFAAGRLSASFASFLADRFNRKRACPLYYGLYALICLCMLSEDLAVLFARRVAGGRENHGLESDSDHDSSHLHIDRRLDLLRDSQIFSLGLTTCIFESTMCLFIFSESQWSDPVRGLFEASDRGATYPFLADGDANLTKGSGFNAVFVKNNTLYTPQRGALEGITRRSVIAAAYVNGIDIHVTTVPIQDVYDTDGILMCTTAGGIMPISHVDDILVKSNGVGPITKKIWDTYWAMHYDDNPSFAVDYKGN